MPEGESIYPPVPPRLPEGDWGKMSREQAWKFHERKNELLAKGSVRERLKDATSTKETMKRWHIAASRDQPYLFPFLQYITKTQLHLQLPKEYVLTPESQASISNLKRRVSDRLKLLHSASGPPSDELSASSKVRIVAECVVAELVAESQLDHLTDGQLDQGTKFEAGWRRSGFEEDDEEDEGPETKKWTWDWGIWAEVGEYKHPDPGILNFQSVATPFLALRYKFPLKVDHSVDPAVDRAARRSPSPSPQSEQSDALELEPSAAAPASLVSPAAPAEKDLSASPFVHNWVEYDANAIPLYAYHPSLLGLDSVIEAPKVNPGFKFPSVETQVWIKKRKDHIITWERMSERNRLARKRTTYYLEKHAGVEYDPAQFPHTAFFLSTGRDGLEENCFEEDEEQMAQWDAAQALTGLFTWNLAAAHMQGFNPYLDNTYPIVSQAVVSDGTSWQFFVFEMNSMELWRDDNAFTKKNVLWMSRKLDFDVEEEKDLVLSLLSKFLAKQPQTDLAASDLQPYVTKWDEEEEEFSRKFDFKLAVLAN